MNIGSGNRGLPFFVNVSLHLGLKQANSATLVDFNDHRSE